MLTLRPVFSMLMNFPSAAQSLMEIGPLALLWKLVLPGRTSPLTMKLGTGGGDRSGSPAVSAAKQREASQVVGMTMNRDRDNVKKRKDATMTGND